MARDIEATLNAILADILALCLKTKGFHWRAVVLDEGQLRALLAAQGDELYALADPVADRLRKTGGTPLRSVRQVAKLQRVADNNFDAVAPPDMLLELEGDNGRLAGQMRSARAVCERHGDPTTAGLLDMWIEEAEQRARALLAGRRPPSGRKRRVTARASRPS